MSKSGTEAEDRERLLEKTDGKEGAVLERVSDFENCEQLCCGSPLGTWRVLLVI